MPPSSLSPIEYYFGASIKIDATTHNSGAGVGGVGKGGGSGGGSGGGNNGGGGGGCGGGGVVPVTVVMVPVWQMPLRWLWQGRWQGG